MGKGRSMSPSILPNHDINDLETPYTDLNFSFVEWVPFL